MRACSPRQPVTNGTIFLPTSYVWGERPVCHPAFVIQRSSPSAHPGSAGYTQIGGVEEFSVVAGVVLLVEKCEESEVSELRSREQRGVVQERLHFVCTQLL
jgi:hypothetical protein